MMLSYKPRGARAESRFSDPLGDRTLSFAPRLASPASDWKDVNRTIK